MFTFNVEVADSVSRSLSVGSLGEAREALGRHLDASAADAGALLDLVLIHLEEGQPQLVFKAISDRPVTAAKASTAFKSQMVRVLGDTFLDTLQIAQLASLIEYVESERGLESALVYLRAVQDRQQYTFDRWVRNAPLQEVASSKHLSEHRVTLGCSRGLEVTPWWLVDKAKKLASGGEVSEAIADVSRAIELAPQHYYALFLRAYYFRRLLETEKARREILHVHRIAPWYPILPLSVRAMFGGVDGWLRGVLAAVRTTAAMNRLEEEASAARRALGFIQ
jgi:tetratricopeptide (TPR) repeat protein